MAQTTPECGVSPDAHRAAGREQCVQRRCRGRPRLADTDRAQRRLESRKKYDVRRVYLGEAHKLWTDLRGRTSLSDAGLAEHLIHLLNSTHENKSKKEPRRPETVADVAEKQSEDVPPTELDDLPAVSSRVSSLRGLVRWYQDHSRCCLEEPQLRALEPRPDCPTAALWQCDSDHSFVQYLSSSPRQSSHSEEETHMKREGDGGNATVTHLHPATCGSRRRSETQQHSRDTVENVCVTEVQLGATEQDAASDPLPGAEASSADQSHPGESVWEIEMLMEQQQLQGPGPAACPSMPSEDKESEEAGDRERGRDGGDEGTELGKSDQDSLQEVQPVPPAVQGQTFAEPQAPQVPHVPQAPQVLQAPQALSSCALPQNRSKLDDSQLIIITGPSYEGLQLDMADANLDGVACALIRGVAYNQVCSLDSTVGAAEGQHSLAGFTDERLQPSVHTVKLGGNRKCQRSLSRSKRNRQGPVTEEDGMLKMFHCPYEGCSQVYVAISSFQNHVNLVHRKGRTKVCPHPGCGKKFYLSNHLHRHMIIHSGVRDFICETCGKSFKRKNHLEVHRRTHTGETPLQCEICGYQCRQRASLNWHMKKHTPEAQYNYTCELCDKRFEKLDSVKFHKLKSHPDKQLI
ncbi:zinc finger protein 653 isoform X2 [Nelusetta ayraudi]|uniref:zinc finger protein 653 isoform X2 n=1 Tax=Nelusetta ayraudi TaxID=303726 RepID=UPI003F6E5922